MAVVAALHSSRVTALRGIVRGSESGSASTISCSEADTIVPVRLFFETAGAVTRTSVPAAPIGLLGMSRTSEQASTPAEQVRVCFVPFQLSCKHLKPERSGVFSPAFRVGGIRFRRGTARPRGLYCVAGHLEAAMTEALRSHFADSRGVHNDGGNRACHALGIPIICAVLDGAARARAAPRAGRIRATLAEVVIALFVATT
jgi:hypothetical protein